MYSDRQLSQKLERAEGRANADFVETRARLFPESGAGWIEVAGTYAMLKVSPEWDGLRDDPRFTEILKKTGLP